MPYFLLPKMEGDLVPFGKAAASSAGVAGYDAGRDRGANASANLMRTYPRVTRRWWAKEFEQLRSAQQKEERIETEAAFKLAADRGERHKDSASDA